MRIQLGTDSAVSNQDRVTGEELETGPVFDSPACPGCGWHNTRRSYSTTIIDPILKKFSIFPYRCRACSKRFRVRMPIKTLSA